MKLPHVSWAAYSRKDETGHLRSVFGSPPQRAILVHGGAHDVQPVQLDDTYNARLIRLR